MTQPTALLAPGDRVIERRHAAGHVITKASPAFEQVRRFMGSARTGEVIEIFEQRNAKGSRCRYARVLWDGLSTPSTHGIARLAKLSSACN